MPVSAIVAAGALFELSENRMRVAVARLLAAGHVARDDRGRYRLGDRAEPIDRRVRSWRRLEERTRRWNGGWTAVHLGPTAAGRSRACRDGRALRLLGFETLVRGLAVRPDNLRGGADGVRGELTAVGLDPASLVFRAEALDAVAEARARGLWDAETLLEGYARSLREVEASERHLASLSEEEAMVESFLLGGRVIRQLVLDPLLPEAIAPAGPRRSLVAAMRRYDRAGRRCWAPFLQRFGALHVDTPADTRVAEGAGRLTLH